MNKLLLLGIAVLIVMGAFLLTGSKKGNYGGIQNQTVTTTPSVAQSQRIPTPGPSITVTVTVTNAGFVPQTITAKAGTRVVWKNTSGKTVTVNSAIHPTHLLYPPLNLGEFGDGSSVQLIFDKPGTYKYHNHLDASQGGTVIIE